MMNYMLNVKVIIILLTVGLIKNTQLNQKVELDLPSYTTKFDLKNATGLKSDVDKLDIDKLEKTPNDLSS